MEKKIEKESGQNDEKIEASEINEKTDDQILPENPEKKLVEEEGGQLENTDQAAIQKNDQTEIVPENRDKNDSEEVQGDIANSDDAKLSVKESDKEPTSETKAGAGERQELNIEENAKEIETRSDDSDVNSKESIGADLTTSEKDEEIKIDSSNENESNEISDETAAENSKEDPAIDPPIVEEKIEERHLDYTKYSKKQMVQVLESLQKENDFSQIGKILKEIKRAFDPIVNIERNAAYDKYIADGGEKDGFEYHPDDLDKQYQNLFNKLRERKNEYFNSQEKQKEHNLNLKSEIIEKLRALIDAEETGSSIKIIKDLQSQWKEVGLIPFSQVKTLWANYNALLDRYYDQRSIYFELKELDRKKNYDLKIELCKKAETLSAEENIRGAIRHLNELHEEFRHIGPVPKVDQEAVWERFKSASDKIYLKRKAFYEKLKDEHKINEVAKEALIEKVIPFTEFSSEKISDWNTKTKEILSIQKEWDTIGSLSKEKAKNINKKFWVSFKSFFNKKGKFFKKLEEGRRENLIFKQQLVEKAEALKESDDFNKTSDELKQLQRQWKESGPVPEKNRNEIYLKFKIACDYFFDRRRENSGVVAKDYEANLNKKQLLCKEIETMINAKKIEIDRIKKIEVEWSDIGFVPKSSIKSIQEKYLGLINKVTDSVNIPEIDKQKLRLSAQFNKSSDSPGVERLIIKKEGAIRRQISNLESDINLWANNIDFFASSKNADKLKEEYQLKIDNATTQVQSLKDQLKIIVNI